MREEGFKGSRGQGVVVLADPYHLSFLLATGNWQPVTGNCSSRR